jgi:hypothetical protein
MKKLIDPDKSAGVCDGIPHNMKTSVRGCGNCAEERKIHLLKRESYIYLCDRHPNRK